MFPISNTIQYALHHLLATLTINTNWNFTTTTKTKTPLWPSIFIQIFIVIGIGIGLEYCELWMSFINIIATEFSSFFLVFYFPTNWIITYFIVELDNAFPLTPTAYSWIVNLTLKSHPKNATINGNKQKKK